MTDFKVGDRVRCRLGENVLVGKVTWIGHQNDGWVDVDISDASELTVNIKTWQIEKVSPPLPTKVGAIVRRADGKMFALINEVSERDDRWIQLHPGDYADWAEIDDVVHGDFEVIFEGVDA